MAVDSGAVILAVIASTPGTLALLTRNKSVKERAEATAKRTTLDEFNSLFEEQRKQISDCRNECGSLKDALAERERKDDIMDLEIRRLTIALDTETKRREFLEQVIRMRGGDPNSGDVR